MAKWEALVLDRQVTYENINDRYKLLFLEHPLLKNNLLFALLICKQVFRNNLSSRRLSSLKDLSLVLQNISMSSAKSKWDTIYLSPLLRGASLPDATEISLCTDQIPSKSQTRGIRGHPALYLSSFQNNQKGSHSPLQRSQKVGH